MVMNIFGRLRIRGKFAALFAGQVVFLGVIALMGALTIGRVVSRLEVSGADLDKARMLTSVLNDVNSIRTIHVSLIAAAKEIAQLAEQNASATVQLASSIQETSRTIDDLARQAGDLHRLTGKFKLS